MNTRLKPDLPGYPINRSWVEVDLDAIEHNIRAVRRLLWHSTQLMCVVKADAYGHGVRRVVGRMQAAGADRLAVSMLDEAIQLRRLGIHIPILVLSYTDPARAEEIVSYGITQTIYSPELVTAIDNAARRLGVIATVHVKVDTGMGRVGYVAGFDTVRTVAGIAALSHVRVEGVYTHFATADEEDTDYVRAQFGRFLAVCQELERAGVYVPIKHCCNSAALLRFPEMHLDMVRPGLVLYGQMPDCCGQFRSLFRPAMSLHSDIIHVKEVEAGSAISYGRRFVTQRPSRIATIPIGYADGFTRRLTGRAGAVVGGVRVPVVGSICMDACMLDVTDVPGPVRPGDEALLFGVSALEPAAPAAAGISVDEFAGWSDSISYEVMSVIGKRVPRVYVSGGRVESVETVIV
ncbi:MAG: alanine racemase [Bacillota bacterium]|nr:alanine racemase [Bacillota bacterium]